MGQATQERPSAADRGGGTTAASTGVGLGGLAVALAALLIIATVIANRFLAEEEQRDLLDWQVRLGIVLDSRVAVVADWLDEQAALHARLAENPGLRLVAGQLAAQSSDAPLPPELAAQLGFIRNLLTAEADRFGFTVRPDGPDVPANVDRQGVAGLALVSLRGGVLAASPGMPEVAGDLLAFIATQAPGQPAVRDLYAGTGDRISMAFLAPVFPEQGGTAADDQVAWVLGVRPVAEDLFTLLRQPGQIEETAEIVLLSEREGAIAYLSPLIDGTPPLSRRLAADTPDLAAGFALAEPGGFAERTDYRGRSVLVTARRLDAAPGWTVMHKVDRAEALAAADARRGRLAVQLVVGVALAVTLVLIVFFYGTSRRARDAAARYQAIAMRLEQSEQRLRLVTDSQPNAILMVGAEDRVRYANAVAARQTGSEPEALIGKPLDVALGPHWAQRVARLAALCRERLAAIRELFDETEAADGSASTTRRVVNAHVIPLPGDEGSDGAVLVVEEDLTQAVLERERREAVLRQIVTLLVTVVDRRDPHSADHSRRLSLVGAALSREMDQPPALVETVTTAALLLNLGKILVPVEVLTKPGALSEQERQLIRGSLATSAELIRDIAFDGPVYETLAAVQERYDGTGWPDGLAGAAIPPAARLLAVANAFIALISTRAHRGELDVDAALARLAEDSGRAFDPNVVVALTHLMNNKQGRQLLGADKVP